MKTITILVEQNLMIQIIVQGKEYVITDWMWNSIFHEATKKEILMNGIGKMIAKQVLGECPTNTKQKIILTYINSIWWQSLRRYYFDSYPLHWWHTLRSYYFDLHPPNLMTKSTEILFWLASTPFGDKLYGDIILIISTSFDVKLYGDVNKLKLSTFLTYIQGHGWRYRKKNGHRKLNSCFHWLRQVLSWPTYAKAFELEK